MNVSYMAEKQIQILMATYNGDRFIGEQINSLIGQTNQDWQLLIRDDNSTDNTVKIVNDFISKYPDKISLLRDADNSDSQNRQLGALKNFGRLLENATSKYVMFCDQDDVWNPNKIELSLAKIKDMEATHGIDTPLLVHSNYTLTNANGNTVKLCHNVSYDKKLDLRDLLKMDISAPGMSMMMNDHLAKQSIPISEHSSMHDSWVLKVAASIGKVGYINTPLVNYRIHNSNVCGASLDTKPKNWLDRISEELHNGVEDLVTKKTALHKKKIDTTSNISMALLERFGDKTTPENKKLLEVCSKLSSMSAIDKRLTMIQHNLMPSKTLTKISAFVFS
jgi:glycosyltransferase involved in cell wall biosynthesis